MIRSIARAIAGSVSTPITGSGPSEPQAPIIASVTISGGTLVGSVLSSSISYTQAPIPAGTVTYQWDRNGSPISGATSASYTLVEADAGAAITLDVSVTNSEGSDSATSNTINAAALAVPSITGVPTISGTLYEGNTLTATAASVTGNPPPATTWQWERDGTPISGATSQTYTLVSADGNTDITVVQTETNSQGSDTAESAASTIEAAPVISGVPTISGSESVGSTLTATAASVTGTPTPTRTWQWQRSADGSTGWTNISGATASTYTLVSADLNQYLRVSQIETNTSGGQTRADSAESAASGQIGRILDSVTSAVLAFSVARKLRTAYTGSALRVRRSSDDAEQDIGFDGSGNLDESALTTFVGANDGYVVTAYDQSTSGNDATQATAAEQPQIVASGSIIKRNGKPFLRVPDTSGSLVTASNTGITGSAERTLYVVGYRNSNAVSDTLAAFGVAAFGETWSFTAEYGLRINNGSRLFVTSPPAAVELSASVLPPAVSNATGITVYVDGALQTQTGVLAQTVNTGASPLYIGSDIAAGANADADISEVILLDSGGATDRGTLDTSASSFFGVSI